MGVSASTSRQLHSKLPLSLYPRGLTNIAVSKKPIAIDHSDDSSFSSDEERPKLTPDATPLQEIFWRGIDMDHVSAVIPNSLNLVLSVLFVRENILELEEQDNSLKVRNVALLKI